MSSKTANDTTARSRKPWSLAARLTAWYVGASFIVVLLATSVLYIALAETLDREDDEFLAAKARAVRGVLARRPYDPADLQHEVEESPQSHHTRVFVRVLSAGGDVLAETSGLGDTVPVAAFPSPNDEPGVGVNFRSDAGGVYRLIALQALRSDVPLTVQVAMDRTQEDELLEAYRRNLLVILIGAVAFCGIAGYLIARRGLRSVRAIAETVQRVRPVNLGERIVIDGLPAELMALVIPLNDMLDRLDQSFARLTQFSADIAHELRTPVNNLRGEIEVALGRQRTTDEYCEVLSSSLEECGRLTRLIDALLFLARAENPRRELTREPLDIATELMAVREFYEAAATEQGIELQLNATGPIIADLNRTFFQRAVGNLVANAIAHTPSGGTVTLTATLTRDGAIVEVVDTGCGIAAIHLPHIFDRFFRVDEARISSRGNLGLGLAIVKRIVEMHGGTIRISSEYGRGTRVTLIFPGRSL